jgi:pyrroline-5-carboxylate reductase
MKNSRIGFIGGGNMARALIAGLVEAGVPATHISVGEPLAAQRERLAADYGVQAHADNDTVVAGADALLLAVKPQELPAVLLALRPALAARHPLLISIAAGIRMASIAAWAPGCPVVRAMPNRGALLRAGATAVCAAADTSPQQRRLAEALLRASGLVVWVPEETQLDAVTALSGSGPAYFFWLAEQMAAAGVALGLDGATAHALAAATLHGAGVLAHADADLAAQRTAVTSRGGTTEAALAVFNASDAGLTVLRAMRAATERGQQLAQLNS